MNAKLSQHMTLLGLCSVAFYGVMLASGKLSIEVMPQFLISAAIFLMSGHVMRKAVRIKSKDHEEDRAQTKPEKAEREETDWPFMTNLLNWTAALLVVGIMAIFIMKPAGITFTQAFSETAAHENFFAGHVP
ncbi:hypothetical protein SAMN05660860_00229 [Geoalkalibacter ferrihydriticus]|uniref:Uncharacterized protein n=2 Tax=Geoalkalibacter ferrihydriticus TaxID=392333 RepID=A0A0C2HSB0_9BACT|nr:hypothetical protein [Geoalkalibacter ferrihydriticus]KIH75627.1 hypothetical protein GFER_16000 [Geoalkalibacter ferrihydriticus DSM 17813]SDL28233.1 hypothetical protein SAMN05660860_00229 [Geoalkalibacter ferrihydriticus]